MDCFQFDAHIARQPQGFALPEHFKHPVKIGARVGSVYRGLAGLVGFLAQGERRLDGGLNSEWATDTGDFVVNFWSVNQRNRFWLLIVSDGF
jgi:hypothetical protein